MDPLPITDTVAVMRSALKKRPEAAVSQTPFSTPKKRISFNPIDSNGTPVRFLSSDHAEPADLSPELESQNHPLTDELSTYGCSLPPQVLPSEPPPSHGYFTEEEVQLMSNRATTVLAGTTDILIRPACYQVWMTAETKSRVIDCSFFKDDLMNFQDLNGKVRRILLNEAAYYSIQTAARQLSLVFWSAEEIREGHLPSSSPATPCRKQKKTGQTLSQAVQSVTESEGKSDETSSQGKENMIKHWDHFRDFWIKMLGYEETPVFRKDLDDVLVQAVSSMKKKMTEAMSQEESMDLRLLDAMPRKGKKRKRGEVKEEDGPLPPPLPDGLIPDPPVNMITVRRVCRTLATQPPIQ